MSEVTQPDPIWERLLELEAEVEFLKLRVAELDGENGE